MKAESGQADAAAAEVPLWFETGWSCPGAVIAVIECPEEIRYERLRKNRGWSDEKIAAVDGWQWNSSEKAEAADLLIRNEGTLKELDQEMERFFQAIEERKKEKNAAILEKWRTLWEQR